MVAPVTKIVPPATDTNESFEVLAWGWAIPPFRMTVDGEEVLFGNSTSLTIAIPSSTDGNDPSGMST